MKKESLKTLDILHCHNPFVWYKPWRYLSLAIRSFQKLRFGKYSWSGHTAIVVKDNKGIVWVYEADPKVKKTKWDEWSRDIKVSITRYPELKVQEKGVLKYCEMNLDTRYDIFGLVLWQPIYILTKKWYGKKNNGKFYCSEFAASVINNFIGHYPNMDEINPSKLYCDMIDYQIYKGNACDIK
jgi:hypothetical protein